MNIYDALQINFETFRKKAGLNKTEVAEKAKIERTELSKKINGDREIRLADIEAIAKVLRVKPHQLLQSPEDLETEKSKDQVIADLLRRIQDLDK